VVVFFTVIGFQRQKMGFIKHMMGPVWYLAPLIFVIEMFSTFVVRPGSLSLRLAGNMNGDHAVLGVTYQFAEYVLPTAALALGTFVSFVQAFVFTLLTMIYVVFSLEHEDHH
jgi:F-type H+-transporting ATPase subunit a